MKCFYHGSDFDGRCSGAIIKTVFPECEMHPIDYKDKFPITDIESDERIFIVDFSIEPKEMKLLLTRTKKVCWIDHHKTAIEKYKDFEDEIDGIREVGKSGCMLSWEWFYAHEDIPWVVKYVDDWDVWKHEFKEKTLHFQSGLGIYSTDPESPIWKILFGQDPKQPQDELLSEILGRGNIIEAYKQQHYKEYLDAWGYETNFEKHRCIALNLAKCSSKAFDSISEKNYDIYISYIFDGENYTISLYSTKEKIDVSKIAVKYGGGGHKGASGFIAKKLPFIRRRMIDDKKGKKKKR